MISAKRIAANRRNARRSTGPRTPEGKSRSRMNAVKHGLDAQAALLPGEDEAAYQARLRTWLAGVCPRDDLESSLVEQAARLSWQLDRADRYQSAVLNERIQLAIESETGRPAREAAEAAITGQKLLDGPPAPEFKDPRLAAKLGARKLPAPMHPDDPDHPERLLLRLESTAGGCRWLLDRWTALRAILEEDPDAWWGPAERIRAVRMLGRQPVDASRDPMVQAIYLCSFRMDPAGPRVLADQADELTNREFDRFLDLLKARRVSERMPPDRASAREELLALVDGIIEGLLSLESAHVEQNEALAATAPARLAFDETSEGDRLRRLQRRLMNALLRTIDTLRKTRLDPAAACDHAMPTQPPLAPEDLVPNPAATAACEESRNEPTADAGPLPNEPTADAGPLPNEPTAEPDSLPNEPTAGPESLRNEPTAPTVALADPPAGSAERTQPISSQRWAAGLVIPGTSFGAVGVPPLDVLPPKRTHRPRQAPGRRAKPFSHRARETNPPASRRANGWPVEGKVGQSGAVDTRPPTPPHEMGTGSGSSRRGSPLC